MTLRDLIPSVTEVARKMNLTQMSIYRWIENDAVPPKQIIRLANALDVDIPVLLPYARKATVDSPTIPKSHQDLEAINNAYCGRPYTTTLSPHAVKIALARWGDKWPEMYATLHALKKNEMSVDQATKRLGITKSALHNLRRRYGMSNGRKQVVKSKPTKADLARKVAIDVIAGRLTAADAARNHDVSKRTIHRYVDELIKPLGLQDLTHWGVNWRFAYALEVSGKSRKTVLNWRSRWDHLELKPYLPKEPKWPKPVTDWRTAKWWRIVVAYLIDEASVSEIAENRRGSEEIVESLINKHLTDSNLDCMGLSLYHKLCAAEVLVAENSVKRVKNELL